MYSVTRVMLVPSAKCSFLNRAQNSSCSRGVNTWRRKGMRFDWAFPPRAGLFFSMTARILCRDTTSVPTLNGNGNGRGAILMESMDKKIGRRKEVVFAGWSEHPGRAAGDKTSLRRISSASSLLHHNIIMAKHSSRRQRCPQTTRGVRMVLVHSKSNDDRISARGVRSRGCGQTQ